MASKGKNKDLDFKIMDKQSKNPETGSTPGLMSREPLNSESYLVCLGDLDDGLAVTSRLAAHESLNSY